MSFLARNTISPAAVPLVLLVDDDPIQLKLARMQLVEAGFDVEASKGPDEALALALARRPDAILSDVFMANEDGFGLCRRVRLEPTLSSVPVILLSSHCHSEAHRQLAARSGAYSLIERTPDIRDAIDMLRRCLSDRSLPALPSGDRALYEEHLRTNANQIVGLLGKVRNAEERYRELFENANDTITLLSHDGIVLEVNDRWKEVLGVEPEQMIGRHIREFAAPGEEAANTRDFQQTVADGRGRSPAVAIRRPDGRIIYMEFSNANLDLDGTPYVLAIGRDVTSYVEAMRSLATAEGRYRSMVERIPDVIWTATLEGQFTFVTPNVAQMFGFSADEMCAVSMEDRSCHIHPEDRDGVVAAMRGLADGGIPFDVEYRRQRKDGVFIWIRNRSFASYEKDGVRYIEGMMSDITEKRLLEEGMRQAQKMEAIGQLTGGIAHDFNNMLAVILANVHFVIEDLAEQDPRRSDAEQIKLAADRAAALTRQLLAFSRRQVLDPTTVDLNKAVAGVEKMVRRLIGEDIDFTVVPGADLGSVRVDVGQLEQVIMNLVVNARDAMPKGGKLLIETTNVDLDEHYTASHRPVVPGKYVMMSVTDTGCGMEQVTLRRVFEPFFTTKEVGKGTGLGLSTCFGIVKQSGGYIWVYSEPGRGTAFKVYLPRIDEAARTQAALAERANLDGDETILVVEDDERVRSAVTRILRERGYRLLVAKDGSEALASASAHPGTIDLVLSDVIMPGLSGPETVAELAKRLGIIQTLFMSGYSDRAALGQGSLRPGTNFIQKPFAPDVLARKVREVLDAEAAAA